MTGRRKLTKAFSCTSLTENNYCPSKITMQNLFEKCRTEFNIESKEKKTYPNQT